MPNKIYKDIVLEVSKKIITQEIERKRAFKEVPEYTTRTVGGLAKILTDIIMTYRLYPHVTNGIIDGYHVDSQQLKKFKLNKLCPLFLEYNLDVNGENISVPTAFFKRAENSTYHVNTSKMKNNGYSHWYIPSKTVKRIVTISDNLLERKLRHDAKFSAHESKYLSKIQSALKIDEENVDTSKYLKIPKDIIGALFSRFKDGKYDGFLTILNRLVYIGKNHWFFENSIKDDLDGLGREYTLVGALPKEIRNEIFEGRTEIDVNCGIQTVLLNLYYRGMNNLEQLKKDFPKHYELITDKVRFREYVALTFKCNVKMAKEIITSISYSPNTRIIHKYGNMRGLSPDRIMRCKKLVDGFINETKEIREKVLKHFYHENKELQLIIDSDIADHNQKLAGKGKGKSLNDRRIFRIYSIYENQIRSKMLQYLDITGHSEIYQIHDCVIVDSDVDIREMRHFIYKEIRFNVGLTKEVYKGA